MTRLEESSISMRGLGIRSVAAVVVAVACLSLGDGQVVAGAAVRPAPAVTKAVQVSAGGELACAVTTRGGVECWGDNTYRELGAGEKAGASYTPVGLVGMSTGAKVVSVGLNFGCVLTTGGVVKCWGSDPFGVLGRGRGTFSPTPGKVAGLPTGLTFLSVSSLFGNNHVCVLTAAGGVKCWGDITPDSKRPIVVVESGV